MFSLVVSVFLFSSSVIADEVFKCTAPDGGISYQAQPCAGGQDTDKVEVDNTPAPGYTPKTYPRYQAEPSIDEQLEDIRRESAARRSEIMDDYYEQKCERLKSYLTSAEDKWERVRKQGYRQWEKDYYEELIAKREREVEIGCR